MDMKNSKQILCGHTSQHSPHGVFMSLIVLFWGAGASCTQAEVVPNSQAWETEEPLENTESVSPPNEEPIENVELPARIEFEPGELSWAKPGYRVVFHTKTESDQFILSKALDPYLGSVEEGLPPIEEREHLFHSIQVLPAQQLVHLHAFNREYDALSESGKPWPKFQGIYFPEELRQEEVPTLHMFQLAEQYQGLTRYRVGDLFVSIKSNAIFVIRVGVDSPQGQWLRCSAIYSDVGELDPGCDTDSTRALFVPDQGVAPMEHVLWPGIDPRQQTSLEAVLAYSSFSGTHTSGRRMERDGLLQRHAQELYHVAAQKRYRPD